MSVREDLAEAYAEAFDAKKEVYFGAGATLVLLKVDGGAQAYSELTRVETGWFAKFSDYFGSTTFEVANTGAEFAAKVSESAFLAVVGSENEVLEGQLHAINRETTRPAGVDPFWRIRATATGKRYVPA